MSDKSPGKGELREEHHIEVPGEIPPSTSAIADAINGVPMDPFGCGRPLDPQPPSTPEERSLTGEEFGE